MTEQKHDDARGASFSDAVFDLTQRQRRLLERFIKGECPRCSRAEHLALMALPGMAGLLQLESAHGADTRSGYSLNVVWDDGKAEAAAQNLLSLNV